MDLEKLRKQLEIDEGVKYEIYNDHLGYPTFGIGHLVIPSDIEYREDVGTRVSEERVRECFDKDVQSVLRDCTLLYKDFDELSCVNAIVSLSILLRLIFLKRLISVFLLFFLIRILI